MLAVKFGCLLEEYVRGKGDIDEEDFVVEEEVVVLLYDSKREAFTESVGSLHGVTTVTLSSTS